MSALDPHKPGFLLTENLVKRFDDVVFQRGVGLDY